MTFFAAFRIILHVIVTRKLEKLVRWSQIMQNVIYGSDREVAQYRSSSLPFSPLYCIVLFTSRFVHFVDFEANVTTLLCTFNFCNSILLFSLPMYATRYLCFQESIRKMCIFLLTTWNKWNINKVKYQVKRSRGKILFYSKPKFLFHQ